MWLSADTDLRPVTLEAYQILCKNDAKQLNIIRLSVTQGCISLQAGDSLVMFKCNAACIENAFKF